MVTGKALMLQQSAGVTARFAPVADSWMVEMCVPGELPCAVQHAWVSKGALLVADKLQVAAKLLVVVGQPLQQGLLLLDLQQVAVLVLEVLVVALLVFVQLLHFQLACSTKH